MTAFHDELLRERADRHKPTFSRLRYEGVSRNAAIGIHAGRDALAEKDWTAEEIVDLIQGTGAHPFTAADVPPMHRREIEEPSFDLRGDWDALAERVLADWDRVERAEVAAAVRGIGPAYDREQEQAREIEASNERQSRAYREWDRRVAGGVR